MAKQLSRRAGRVTLAGIGKAILKYLDDLLALASGICFVASAYELAGAGWAKATAGVCLLFFSIMVARAKKDG